MYHISDLKKFSKCPRLYFLDMNDETVSFQPYLRLNESYIDLLKEKLNIKECFTGEVGDSKDRFYEFKDRYEWFINTRFEIDKLRIKIPLLHKVNGGYEVYFLYYGTNIKELDFFAYRLNIQVLEKLGFVINEIYFVYINPDYICQGKQDPDKLFVITKKFRTGRLLNILKETIIDYKDIINKIESSNINDMPIVKSRICHSKNICQYYNECFKNEINIEDNSILSLVSSQYKNQMFEEGIKYLKDVDLNRLEGNRVQYAQVMADKLGGLFVDKIVLNQFLQQLEDKPLSYVDFEWDTYLIPPYKGMKPLDVMPFEYALYIENENGKIEHKTFISNGDCRKEFIESLIANLPKEGKILAYNATGAEVLKLNKLAEQFPEYKEEIAKIVSRFVDLATPFVEGMVYDTKMAGNFTLKKLVSIVSDKSYKDLDVSDGLEAVKEWRIIDKGNEENKSEIIDNLKQYCSLDAYGLLLVYKWLKNIAK